MSKVSNIMVNKKFTKLATGGCSYSDYAEVDINYSEIIAKKLNLEYIPYTACVGSNFRIWRMIIKDILNGKIDKNTLLIIQYTEPVRNEMFSKFILNDNDGRMGNTTKGSYLREDAKNGQIIKYKLGSYKWQKFKEEIKLHKLIDENFISDEYSNDLFDINHYGFSSILKENGITTIFLTTAYIKEVPQHYNENLHYIDVRHLHSTEFGLSDTDIAHLSEHGHGELANIILNYINNL